MRDILIPGIPLFDPEQSLESAEDTAALLAWGLESGPERVIPLAWGVPGYWFYLTTQN